MNVLRKIFLLLHLIVSANMVKVFEAKGENDKVNKEFAKVCF